MGGLEERTVKTLLKCGSAICLAVLAIGCANTSATKPAAQTSAASQEQGVSSPDPRVKFKDGERYLADLGESLEMPRETICRELGRYDCFNQAFRIVLGGMEGPNLLVNQPLEVEALTAPIAYDRVALNVCTSRVAMDAAEPAKAVLYRSSGKPGAKAKQSWLRATADGIYGSVLRRPPTAEERARLIAFYDDVRASGESPDPAKDWTVLGCLSVATSLEALFY
jgi:hypothetical protein